MIERPIVFSAPEVRAILAGIKTQTRRVVKLPKALAGGDLQGARPDLMWGVTPGLHVRMPDGRAERLRNPWMWPEPSRLWVRETWAPRSLGHLSVLDGLCRPRFCANDDPTDALVEKQWRGWRPAHHMPRWASRISLDVIGVRVERLHEISEADASAEDVSEWARAMAADPNISAAQLDQLAAQVGHGSLRAGFACMWEATFGPGSWKANPWVWVIEFKRVAP